jgi:hypothetical protein
VKVLPSRNLQNHKTFVSQSQHHHILFVFQQDFIMVRCSLNLVGVVSALFVLALASSSHLAMASDTTIDDGGHTFGNGKRAVWFLIAAHIACRPYHPLSHDLLIAFYFCPVNFFSRERANDNSYGELARWWWWWWWSPACAMCCKCGLCEWLVLLAVGMVRIWSSLLY